jgi:hypothetical protein
VVATVHACEGKAFEGRGMNCASCFYRDKMLYEDVSV